MKYNRKFLERIAPGTIDHESIIEPSIGMLLGDVQGKRVLDIGCGSGRYARFLADCGAVVTGIDRNESQLDLAREAEKENPKGIEYVFEDVRSTTVLPASYDVVLLMFLIVDAKTPDAIQGIVRAAARSLNSGGRVLIADLHPHNLSRDNQVEMTQLKEKSNYFDNGAESYSDTVLTNGDRVRFNPNYHYRLDFVLNTIADEGLILQRFLEPMYRADFPTHMLIVARKD